MLVGASRGACAAGCLWVMCCLAVPQPGGGTTAEVDRTLTEILGAWEGGWIGIQGRCMQGDRSSSDWWVERWESRAGAVEHTCKAGH